MDMKLEVVVVPVSDVDKAKDFYQALGFRLDIDYFASAAFRVVQLTPPGSECSIIIGAGVTSAEPGSAQGLQLVVADIEAARAELAGRGAGVSGAFHDTGGVFHHAHSLHEQEIGRADPDWPRWYAEYMTRTAGQDGYIPAHRAAPAASHAEV
jgi:catechol 2,3-dioxygenase-like lactoylglutathione lyase family enzyme